MIKPGDIVWHDNLIFNDKFKDQKEKRPCIVLFTFDDKDGERQICTCPVTSSVKTFNKNPNKYLLITDVIYNYHKFSFAKLDDINFYPISETHSTGITVDMKNVDDILKRANKNSNKFSDLEKYKLLQRMLLYLTVFKQIEEKELKRQERQKKNSSKETVRRLSKPKS